MQFLKIIIVLILLAFYSCSNSLNKQDIYVDRLVYEKKDSILFTGVLKSSGGVTFYSESFCKGMPCKGWSEVERDGSVVHKGKYLNKYLLSNSTQLLIETDTFLIGHWQEGESLRMKYSPYLTIIILKDEDFFKKEKFKNDDYILLLAKSVKRDISKIKYDFIQILFVNQVYDWDVKCFNYSKRFKREDLTD
jgi:hypothetical protein